MMTYEQQLVALATPPNPNVICKKQGMSYLEGYYVRLLANRVFGPTSVHISNIEHNLTQETKDGRTEVEYTCTTAVKVLFANGEHRSLMASGGGRGYGAEAHQQAKMEAETHAFKRALSNLGPAFGLTLYDGNNPLHNGGPCCWSGFQDGQESSTPDAGPTQAPPPPPPKPEPQQTALEVAEEVLEKWTDKDRKAFCSNLNRLGVDYMSFAVFCVQGLETQRPSAWTQEDRDRALRDLQPGNKLRTRYLNWKENDQADRSEERQANIPTTSKAKPRTNPVAQAQLDYNDDDIPF
jgi:hypothetical protein